MVIPFPRFLPAVSVVLLSLVFVACAPKTDTSTRSDSALPASPTPASSDPQPAAGQGAPTPPPAGGMIPPPEIKRAGSTAWDAFNTYYTALENFYAEVLGSNDKLPKDLASYKELEQAAKGLAEDKNDAYKDNMPMRSALLEEVKRLAIFSDAKAPGSVRLESIAPVVQFSGDVIRMMQPPPAGHMERLDWLLVNLRFNVQKFRESGH